FYTCRVSTGCVAVSDAALLSIASGACCPADFNGDGSLTPQDIFDFLNAWFSGSVSADFDHMGGLAPQDIFDFLNAWFAGC
ncbi:MAG TPA: GC-type dockerin domain-anchored protein, partial [Phycisphaerales bacterium]|nr:GC-type dockerin domain-anchored protein [Phycisphaerales bacterium]